MPQCLLNTRTVLFEATAVVVEVVLGLVLSVVEGSVIIIIIVEVAVVDSMHSKVPCLLMHVELLEQESVDVAHSSISKQSPS